MQRAVFKPTRIIFDHLLRPEHASADPARALISRSLPPILALRLRCTRRLVATRADIAACTPSLEPYRPLRPLTLSLCMHVTHFGQLFEARDTKDDQGAYQISRLPTANLALRFPERQTARFSLRVHALVLLGLGALGRFALAFADGAAADVEVELTVVVEPEGARKEVVDDPL